MEESPFSVCDSYLLREIAFTMRDDPLALRMLRATCRQWRAIVDTTCGAPLRANVVYFARKMIRENKFEEFRHLLRTFGSDQYPATTRLLTSHRYKLFAPSLRAHDSRYVFELLNDGFGVPPPSFYISGDDGSIRITSGDILELDHIYRYSWPFMVWGNRIAKQVLTAISGTITTSLITPQEWQENTSRANIRRMTPAEISALEDNWRNGSTRPILDIYRIRKYFSLMTRQDTDIATHCPLGLLMKYLGHVLDKIDGRHVALIESAESAEATLIWPNRPQLMSQLARYYEYLRAKIASWRTTSRPTDCDEIRAQWIARLLRACIASTVKLFIANSRMLQSAENMYSYWQKSCDKWPIARTIWRETVAANIARLTSPNCLAFREQFEAFTSASSCQQRCYRISVLGNVIFIVRDGTIVFVNPGAYAELLPMSIENDLAHIPDPTSILVQIIEREHARFKVRELLTPSLANYFEMRPVMRAIQAYTEAQETR